MDCQGTYCHRKEQTIQTICYPLYCSETKTKFYFKGDVCVSDLPIICLSHIHHCNREAGITEYFRLSKTKGCVMCHSHNDFFQ